MSSLSNFNFMNLFLTATCFFQVRSNKNQGNKSVRNDASELDILGHIEIFRDILGYLGTTRKTLIEMLFCLFPLLSFSLGCLETNDIINLGNCSGATDGRTRRVIEILRRI